MTSLLSPLRAAGLQNGESYLVGCGRSGSTVTLRVTGGNLTHEIVVTYALTRADRAAFGLRYKGGSHDPGSLRMRTMAARLGMTSPVSA